MVQFNSKILLPKTFISKLISKDLTKTWKTFKITAIFTGKLNFQITANNYSNPSWTSVELVSGMEYSGTFNVYGSNISYRIIGNNGATIDGVIIKYFE